ncbi:MAG: hypothetical protein HYY45_21975 [Deltaproteobacteria bacterium]|nr:hypothetical protein [Deltaproteobacteria bacterium]
MIRLNIHEAKTHLSRYLGKLARLPSLHKDPFDRMLICQAIVHGLVILTPDQMIYQYPVKTIW